MLCLSCTIISSRDLAHYGVSRAKDWVSVDCGKNNVLNYSQCFSLAGVNIQKRITSQTD